MSGSFPKRPWCRDCRQHAVPTFTRFGWRFDCVGCRKYAWGIDLPLADASTHEARREAHNAFDPLWRKGRLGRREAYQMLAEELGIPPERCHMKFMDRSTAQAVPSAVDRIRSYALS